ncbi:FadR/GntR family transcriptional regulator [Pararhizobium mangrovi]|uniref:FadR family transcriptional regulator n=1 Tax=Pararhizobium mangrovi TaxID=2590452 RepID=A0A506U3V4_9HYPH|nr:FadR/GntR family transcriptional regulator [Pararhizobium mangrovi]TPW29022.1 FadR family transcriptional regulator [Pararhizobium mangrovi]
MHLDRIDTTDRVTRVSSELAGYVDRGALTVGDQLPTEREISQSLGVGRSTVREVLRQWQALGVVEVRKGSGTFLRRQITRKTIYLPLLLEGKRDGLLQMLEVRRGLEMEAAGLAATRAGSSALAELEEKLVVMEAVFEKEGCAGPEDLAFHLAIYDASGNPLFGQILAQIRDPLNDLFSMSDVSKRLRRFAERSFPFHRRLFEAIRSGDPIAARTHTAAILDVVSEDVRTMVP